VDSISKDERRRSLSKEEKRENRRKKIDEQFGERASKIAKLTAPFNQERVDELAQISTLEHIAIESRSEEKGNVEHLDFSSWSSLEHLEVMLLSNLRDDSFNQLFTQTKTLRRLVAFNLDSVQSLIKELSVLTNLQNLKIERSKIQATDDLLPLGKCVSLENLELVDNDIKHLDLSFVRELKELREFRFAFVWLTLGYDDDELHTPVPFSPIDLAPLSSCPNLRGLVIQGVDLGKTFSLTPLSSCRNLKSVHLDLCAITDIDLSPLDECPISIVSLEGNRLCTLDLTPLSEFYNIEQLHLSYNKIDQIDLTPLSQCKVLRVLNLEGNNLTSIDLSPLSECHYIESVILFRNPLEEVDISPVPRADVVVKMPPGKPKLEWGRI
jgi:Leucine-rich repeat (LRR) protein